MGRGPQTPSFHMNNYSVKIVRANADADQTLLGVHLGQLCIYKGIPVNKVADDLNVSKAVVYKWFTGKHDVGKHLRQKVEAYCEVLLNSLPGASTNNPCPDSTS